MEPAVFAYVSAGEYVPGSISEKSLEEVPEPGVEEEEDKIAEEQMGEEEEEEGEKVEGREEGEKEAAPEPEADEITIIGDDDPRRGGGKKLTNQFNFCERAALTYNLPTRVTY